MMNMKKMTTLFIFGLLNLSLHAQWTYLDSPDTGVHAVDESQPSKNDLLIVSDNELYTAGWYTTLSGTNKRIEVYSYNGTTWTLLPLPESGGNIGDIVLKKASNSSDLYIAYASLNGSNYEIIVKKYNGTNWSSIGNPLPLTSGSSFFSFELDNDDTPIVLGSTNSIISNVNVHRFDGGNWVAYPIPSSAGAVFTYNTSYCDNSNNIVFVWSKNEVVSGNLVQKFHVDTLNGTTLYSAQEGVTVPFSSLVSMVYNGNDFTVYNSSAGGAGITNFQQFDFDGTNWVNTPQVALNASGISALGKAPNGTNLLCQNHPDSRSARLYMETDYNSPVYIPSTTTGIYRLKFSSNFAYCLVNNGVVKHALPLQTQSTVAISETNSFDFNLYPNPTNDLLYIASPINGNVFIYALDGTLLRTESMNQSSMELNVSDLDAGTYLLKLNNQTTRFIKQ